MSAPKRSEWPGSIYNMYIYIYVFNRLGIVIFPRQFFLCYLWNIYEHFSSTQSLTAALSFHFVWKKLQILISIFVLDTIISIDRGC